MRDRASYVLAQGKVRFVVTGPVLPEGPIAAFVQRHGDGVRDVVFETADAEKAYGEAIRRGAVGVETPRMLRDEGIRRRASTWRRHPHSCNGRYRDLPAPVSSGPGRRRMVRGLRSNHVVANVEDLKMDAWSVLP
jgi:4-hydroxyphenylpyruvate dioxygenase